MQYICAAVTSVIFISDGIRSFKSRRAVSTGAAPAAFRRRRSAIMIARAGESLDKIVK
jgi:hypothetical protein